MFYIIAVSYTHLRYVGDDVLSGTINQYSTFDIKATKTSQDSSLKRMIKLVKEADSRCV